MVSFFFIIVTLVCDENLHARHMSISWSCCRTTGVFLGPEFFDPSFSPVAMPLQKGDARIGPNAEILHGFDLLQSLRCLMLLNNASLTERAVRLGANRKRLLSPKGKITSIGTLGSETWWLISLSDEIYPLFNNDDYQLLLTCLVYPMSLISYVFSKIYFISARSKGWRRPFFFSGRWV